MLFTGLPQYHGELSSMSVWAYPENIIGDKVVLDLLNVEFQPGDVIRVNGDEDESYAARVLIVVADRGSLPGPGEVTLEPLGTIMHRLGSRGR